ncbi:MAG: UDP-N-acetylglucosamine 1-carboxyvinyltransferase [bacterium]|nr:UDP-N-acetylglucosamine 1-carboxyvinyltransferase [bacterium]
METFIIQGGVPLSGEIEVRGSKNATFPLMAATILTTQDCVIENVPRIEDIFRMVEIFQGMGAVVEWEGERTLRISTKNLDPARIDRKLVSRLRGSVLLIGPLLARFGRVSFPHPGGCIIGSRPIDTHLDAFSQLGVRVTPTEEGYDLEKTGDDRDREVVLGEFSVTATENILLFASALNGCTTIKIADVDYQNQEIASCLREMGAEISQQEPHSFTIQGKKELGGFRRRLAYDPIEAGTFIVLAAAVKGRITVHNVETRFLDLFLKKMRDFGVNMEIIPSENGTSSVKVTPSSSLHMDKIESRVYPGISSDLQSALGVLATQAQGSTLLFDTLYSGRLRYLEELNKMGAEIYVADPHRAIINGPTQLHGSKLGSYDLRGGMAVVIASLIAKGQSEIDNIYQIDRGYERIEERLQGIGADIKRMKSEA